MLVWVLDIDLLKAKEVTQLKTSGLCYLGHPFDEKLKGKITLMIL